VARAQSAINRLADARMDDGLVVRDVTLLRLRTLLARARGDETAYCDYRDRHSSLATLLRCERYMKWAEAMPGRALMVQSC
jgi:hypothetical protein